MLPKPDKTDYIVAKSYNPITLESAIRKARKTVVCTRLMWKLQLDRGIADIQFVYKKQKPCVQTILRMCYSISEAQNRKSIPL